MKLLKLSLNFSGEQIIGCINLVATGDEITSNFADHDREPTSSSDQSQPHRMLDGCQNIRRERNPGQRDEETEERENPPGCIVLSPEYRVQHSFVVSGDAFQYDEN